MESPVNSFTVDPRLTLIFALLIALILGGNGLLVWQFQIARLQTERVTSGNRQVVAVLRLQETLLSFHQRLDELVQSKDPHRVLAEADPLRKTLVEQIEQTRNTLTHLPPETRVDPAFLPTLDAIEIDLPSQVENVTGLATSGGWEVARIRLADGLKFQENQVAALVKTIDQESNEELANAIASMRHVQQRILFIVPITAISTVFVAAFFGWAIARRILEVRLEERVRERTRIARDLHDTLLQSFQAVLMKLYTVTYQLRDRPEEAWQMLEKVIEQARQAVIEGRDAVQGLRSSTVVTNDLAHEISTLGEELAAAHRGQNCPEFRMQVEGTSRDLAPLVRDDVHRIVSEAMRNAFRHAQAGKIEVEIRYEQRQLRLRVLDNGKGINRKVLAEGGQPGHFGLAGMKERAKLVGGKLAVLSRFKSGTEIEVTIPGSIAYVKSPGVGR
jgi:signal transduction histidine kinase